MNPKKVIIISPAYPYRGGQALVEAYLHNTIKEMGYDTSTISYTMLYPSIFFPGTSQYDKSKLIPFKHTDKIKRIINSINPFTWIRAFNHLKKEKPDAVIYVWWMPFFGPALGYIARRVRKSLKATKNIFLVENYVSHEKRFFDSLLTRKTLKYADIFVSESTYITEQINKGFPEKKVFQTTLSVYDCYDQNRFTKESARNELKITAKNVILFFGMIRPYKGLDKLIETFHEMKHSDSTLLIVGESYESIDKYKKLISDFDLQDRVILVNEFVNNEEIELYFRASDVVVLPYYSGTQSGILMMAYGFGIPVVTTDMGGLGELIIENKTGIIVDDNSIKNLKPAIEKILSTKDSTVYREEIKKFTTDLGYANLKKMFDYCFDE